MIERAIPVTLTVTSGHERAHATNAEPVDRLS
jgi:hypothetical protein